MFASIAAVGAGLAALVDVIQHDAHHFSERTALTFLAGAIVVFLVALSGIHALGDSDARPLGSALVVGTLVIALALVGPALGVGATVLGIGLILSVAVGVHTARNQPVGSPAE